MPKETKKFINPLLRPSQSSETKPTVQAPSETELARTEPQAQNFASDKEVKVEPETAPAIVASMQSEEPALTPQVNGNATNRTFTASDGSNQQTPAPEERNLAGNDEKARDAVKSQTSAKARSNTGPLAEGSAPRSRQAAARRDGNASGTPTRQLSGPLTGGIGINEDFSELDPSSEDSRGGVKRRRNVQPFESTHERITLWMDKQLKQRFEDLAYRRQLSKTSLLNEAVAALLQEYEDR